MSDIANHLQQLQQRAIADLEEKYSVYKALSVRCSQLIQFMEVKNDDLTKACEKLSTENNILNKKVQELELEKQLFANIQVSEELPQVLEVEDGELVELKQ